MDKLETKDDMNFLMVVSNQFFQVFSLFVFFLYLFDFLNILNIKLNIIIIQIKNSLYVDLI